MAKIPFRERLELDAPILGDGAMGTVLHERGKFSIKSCFNDLNLSQPELVLDIHREYLEAGSELIETNTFDANRYKMAEYGLRYRVTQTNRAGVQLARQAIVESKRNDVYLAGSIGPLGVRIKPYGQTTQEEAGEAFHEQLTALTEEGVDALLFETFADHNELLLAIKTARRISPDIPIIAQATFTADHLTYTGFPPARVANDLYKAGVDVIGVNCGGGPSRISQILQRMADAVPDMPLSAVPNAGFPESIGGRVMYSATADYFGEYALTFRHEGAKIIGGCCGTSPEHIAAMRQALDDPTRKVSEIRVVETNGDEQDDIPDVLTGLGQRLANGQFTISVEIAPPRSARVEKLLAQARLLRDAGTDLLNVADTPAARMRMSAWAVCHLLQTRVGIETVLHFPTRGRNLLRVQGDLLAAHALDLRNLFVVMGDPTRVGDYPDAMDTYDIVPSKLISLIKQQMNNGQDMAGNSLGRPTNFTVGCALNMGADDVDREIRVLRKKLAAGANFALGQAVFDPALIERFHKRYEEIEGKPFTLPVMLSIMPLYSVRHAQFLHNEVPGIIVPDAIFRRMEDAGDDAPQEGVKIAQSLLAEMQGMIQGVYVIPSYGRYELAAQVVDAVARGVKVMAEH